MLGDRQARLGLGYSRLASSWRFVRQRDGTLYLSFLLSKKYNLENYNEEVGPPGSAKNVMARFHGCGLICYLARK